MSSPLLSARVCSGFGPEETNDPITIRQWHRGYPVSLRVLLVDSLKDDRALISRELNEHFPDIEIVEAGDPDDLLRAFEAKEFDLAISDHALGWDDGLAVLSAATRKWPRCGTIMYTATGSEEAAVRAMKAGIDEYVVKSMRHLRDLPEIVRRVLDGDREETGDASGPDDPATLRTLLEVTSIANDSQTLTEALERILPELSSAIGFPIGHAWIRATDEEDVFESSGIWCGVDGETLEQFESFSRDNSLRLGLGLPGRATRRGAAVWVEDMGRAIDSPRASLSARTGIGAAVAVPIKLGAEPVAVLEMFHPKRMEEDERILHLMDLAAAAIARVAARQKGEEGRAELQARLMASRKMEAIGRLAGGVAHDFNNLLSVVTLEAEGLLGESGLSPVVRRSLGTILKTAEKAGGLTRRLLTFGWRAPGTPTAVDVGEVVREMRTVLGQLVGPLVTLRVQTAATGARVKADRSQLEQVLLNLVRNAREAMAEGGEITVAVRTTGESPPVDGGASGNEPRVIVSVSDNGPGVPPEIRDRIFEPFFTTRQHGPGTGLGLSLCHSVVVDLGGHIRVHSPPGEGATFEVVLPAEITNGTGAETSRSARPSSEAGESILLVQDEDDLRSVLTRMLTTYGYSVMSVARGEDAMEILESGQRFDAVVADVGLPGIKGPELAQRTRILAPEAAIILTTGYTDMASAPGKAAELDVDDIVAKPFTVDQLLASMRRILDQRRSSRASSRAS